MLVGGRTRWRGTHDGVSRRRIVLALVAVVAAAALPATGAAASPGGTVTDTTPFEWDGPAGPGGLNTGYNPETGDPCTDPATDRCDPTLVEVDSSFSGRVTVSVEDVNTVPGADDFDVYIYESDSVGTRGDLLASTATSCRPDLATVDGISAAPPTTFLLVQVVYSDVAAAERYHAKAEFLRRDPCPVDIDDPPGFQDSLASDPALGFKSHSQPHIAQSPTNPNLLVAASAMFNADQDSLAEYEYKAGSYASFDGGQTWSPLGQLRVCPPASAAPPSWPEGNTCYPNENVFLGGTGSEDAGDPRGTGDFGEEYLTADPWIQFDDEGNAYAAVGDVPPFPGEAGWGVTLHKWSTPSAADIASGDTWSNRIVVNSYPAAATDPLFGTFDAKPTFAVNNAGADGDGTTGTMVACWTRNNDDPSLPIQQIVCERSTDGGATWPGAPQAISGDQELEQGVHVVADPRDPNTFYATWLYNLPGLIGFGLDQVVFTKSTDGGQTWDPARTVADLESLPETFPGQSFRNATIPIGAVGPNSELYVVYSAYRDAPQPNDEDGKQADVMIVRSPDGGQSWFNAVKVNRDSTNADQFQPYVAVNPAGQVNVSYADRRLDARRTQGATVEHPGNFFIDAWLSRSNDGGKSFTDTRVSHDSWDPTIKPPVNCCVEFIGDYQGLVADCSNAIPFVSDTHLANDPARDAGFDAGEPRDVFQQVFSYRVPNAPAFGGSECPKPAQPGAPSPPAAPAPPGPIGEGGLGPPTTSVASGLAISRRRVRISRSGVASFRVKCKGSAECRGRLNLFRFVTKGGEPPNRVTVGTKGFRLAAGAKGVVRVRIASAQRRLARRRGSLRVVAAANARFASGGQGSASEGVTLLPARR